jgi:histidyl-tRNA synthetase
VQVLVASIGPNLLIKRMQLCTRLWSAGIKAEFVFQPKPNMDKQLTYALEEGIPLVVSAPREKEQAMQKGKLYSFYLGFRRDSLSSLGCLL